MSVNRNSLSRSRKDETYTEKLGKSFVRVEKVLREESRVEDLTSGSTSMTSYERNRCARIFVRHEPFCGTTTGIFVGTADGKKLP